jgi:hypothetical protein
MFELEDLYGYTLDGAFATKEEFLDFASKATNDELYSYMVEGAFKDVDEFSASLKKKEDASVSESGTSDGFDAETFFTPTEDKFAQPQVEQDLAAPQKEVEQDVLQEVSKQRREEIAKQTYQKQIEEAPEIIERLQEEQRLIDEVRGSEELAADLEPINDNFLRKSQEDLIPMLSEKYGKYGIVFTPGRKVDGRIVVRTTDGSKQVKIRTTDFEENDHQKLKEFIAANASPVEEIKEEDFITKSFNVKKSRQARVLNEDGSESNVAQQMINEDGSISTVRMASADNFAFPTIFPKDPKSASKDPKDWHVFDIDNREEMEKAIAMAKERGEIYNFKTEEEAIDFAEGSWKDVKYTDTEGHKFFKDKGLDYATVMSAEKRYNDVKEEIAFITSNATGVDRGGEYNFNTGEFEGEFKPSKELIESRPDIYLPNGRIRSDVREKLNELKKEEDDLFNLLRGDENVSLAIDEYNLYLHKKYESLANDAAKKNKEVKDREKELRDSFNALTEDQKKEKKEEYDLKIKELEAEKDGLSDQYFLSKTYLNEKTRQEISKNFTEDFNSFAVAFKNGLNEGSASSILLAVALGMENPDLATAEDISYYLNNMSDTQSRALTRYNQGTSKESWNAFFSSPIEVVSSLIASSLSQTLPVGYTLMSNPETAAAIGATAVLGGRKGGMLGVAKTGLSTLQAATEFSLEYSNAILAEAREAGYNVNDPQKMLEAMLDPEVRRRGHEIGLKRGLAISGVSFLGSQLSGEIFTVSKTATKGEKAAAFVGERIIYDPLVEGTGEAVAQYASGQELSGSDIFDEMISGPFQNTATASISLFRQNDKQSKINLAYDLTDRYEVAKSRESSQRLTNWATEMKRLGQIDDSVNKAIHENLTLRDRANELLSLSKSKKNDNIRARTMDLLKAQKTLSKDDDSKKIYKEELSKIEEEISYMVKQGKMAPADQRVDINNIKDDTREIVSMKTPVKSYKINGRRYSKADFKRKYDKMSEKKRKKATFEIKNDPDFNAQINQESGIMPTAVTPTTTAAPTTQVTDVTAIAEQSFENIDAVPTDIREAATVIQQQEDGTFQVNDENYATIDAVPQEVMASDAVITQKQDGSVDVKYNEDMFTIEAAPIMDTFESMDQIPQNIKDAASTQIVENDKGEFEVTYKEAEVLAQQMGKKQKSEPRFRAEEKKKAMAEIEKRRQAELESKAYNIEAKRTNYIQEDGSIIQVRVYSDGSYKTFSLATEEMPTQIDKGKKELTLEKLEESYGELKIKEQPIKTGLKDKINAKYDAELAALDSQADAEIESSDPRFRLKKGKGRIAQDKKLAADVKKKQKEMSKAEKDFMVPRGKPVREDVNPLAESRSTTKFTEEDAKALGFDSVADMTKKIEDFEGMPMGVVMSDHLAAGNHKDSTGKPMELGGGILFNTLGAIKNRLLAWAGVNKEGANLQYEEAKMIYKANKALFDRLWAEEKLPYGHIPFAVAKMGETAMNSNEANFRWLSPILKKYEAKHGKKLTKDQLNKLSELKSRFKDIESKMEPYKQELKEKKDQLKAEGKTTEEIKKLENKLKNPELKKLEKEKKKTNEAIYRLYSKNRAKYSFEVFVEDINSITGMTPSQREKLAELTKKLEENPGDEKTQKAFDKLQAKQSKAIVLKFIKDNNITTMSQLMDAIVADSIKRAEKPETASLTLPDRAFLFNRVFSVATNVDTLQEKASPSKNWQKVLFKDEKGKFSREDYLKVVANSQSGVYNQITEPSMLDGRQGDIVAIVGIKVVDKNGKEVGGVAETQHNNYGYGPEGKLIAFLSNPMHGTDVFAEWEVKSARVFKQGKGGKVPSKTSLMTQIGGAFFIDKAFRGMKVSMQKDSSQKRKVVDLLVAKMRHAFPSVGITSTQAEFDAIMEKDDVRTRVKDGMVVYGITLDGNIYLNPQAVDVATPIHEFGHIWIDYLRYQALKSPKGKAARLLKKGLELAKEHSKFNEYKRKYGDTELAREELLVELMATRGETIVNESLKAKFKEWFNALFKYIKQTFKTSEKVTLGEIDKLTIEEFANIGLADLFGGTLLDGKFDPSKITDAMRARFSMQTSDGSNMSLSDIITQARQEGYSDGSIKEYLKTQGYKVADINKAMAIQLDINTQMPEAFTNVFGGAKAGIEMFNDIKNKLDNWVKSRWGKGKSFTEYRMKAMELLSEHPLYKAQKSIDQQKLMSGMDTVIGRKKAKDVNAPIKAIRDTLKAIKNNNWKGNIKAVKKGLNQALAPLKGSKVHGANQKKIAAIIKSIKVDNIDAKIKEIDSVMSDIMKDNKEMNSKINNDISEINKKIKAFSQGQADRSKTIKEVASLVKGLTKGTRFGTVFGNMANTIAGIKDSNADVKFNELLGIISDFYALQQMSVDKVTGLETAIENLKQKVKEQKKQARELADIKLKIAQNIKEATQQLRDLGVKEYRYSDVQKLVYKVNNARIGNIDKVLAQVSDTFDKVEERGRKKKISHIKTFIKIAAKTKKRSGRIVGKGSISADGQAFFAAAKNFLAMLKDYNIDQINEAINIRETLSRYSDRDKADALANDPSIQPYLKIIDKLDKILGDNPLLESIPDMLLGIDTMSLEELNSLQLDLKSDKMAFAVELANKKAIEREARDIIEKEASEQIQGTHEVLYNKSENYEITYGSTYKKNKDGGRTLDKPGVPAIVKVTGPESRRKLEVIVDGKVVETVYVKQEENVGIGRYIAKSFDSFLGASTEKTVLEPKTADELNRMKNPFPKVFREEGVRAAFKNMLDKFKLSNYAANFIGHLTSICSILDNLPEGKNFFTENIVNRLNRANSKEVKGLQDQRDKLDSLAKSINPKFTYDTIKEKIFNNTPLKIGGITYSGDQLVRLYALLKNDVQRNKLIKENGFTLQDIDSINYILRPEVKAFADLVVEYLSGDYYEQTNNVYRDVNNVNLPKIDNYFPTQTMSDRPSLKETAKVLAETVTGKLSAQGESFLKQRTNTTGPVAMMAGEGIPYTFTDVLDGLIADTERFKAYAKDTKILNSILSSKEVSNLLKITGLRDLVNMLVSNAVQPISSKNNKFNRVIKGFFSNFIGVKLAYKLWQVPKQASSSVMAFPEYENNLTKSLPQIVKLIPDLAMFLGNLATTLVNPLDYAKAYKTSPMFRERVQRFRKSGFSSLETTITEEQAKNKFIKYFKKIKKAGESLTFVGDIMGVMGYWVNYKRDIKNGMDPKMALEKFENYNKTQQTQRATEINFIQLASRKQPLLMTLTTFASTPFLMNSMILESINNINKQIKSTKGPKKLIAPLNAMFNSKDGYRLMFALGVGNAMFSAVSNVMKLIFGTSEDEEDFEKEVTKAALGYNSLSSLPLFGPAIEYAVAAYEGENVYGQQDIINPFTLVLKELVNSGKEDKVPFLKLFHSPKEKDPYYNVLFKYATGINTDPMIGLYQFLEGERGAGYKALGITKSYLPKEVKSILEGGKIGPKDLKILK